MDWFDKCVLLFLCIIEVFLLFDYFNNFFEIKIPKKNIKHVFVITCALIFGINVLENASVNLFCVPVLLWIFVSILFESRTGVRLGYFVSAYVVMIGVEFLYLILSQTTAEMVAQEGMAPVSEYGWQGILVKFLNFIVFLILKQTSGKAHNRMTNKLFLTYLCIPVSTVGMMLMIFYSGIDVEGYTLFRILMTLFFIFMIIGNMLLFYSFQRYTENLGETTMQQIELAYKNAEIERLIKITEMNDEFNETVHNISHSLKVIGHLARENNVEEIGDIVESLNGKITKKEICEYSSHKLLNVILSEYDDKAKKAGIKFDIYVEPGCTLSHIKDIDLVSMLGNLFDNAILAASKVDNSSIITRIFMHKGGKMCMIKIINDYKEELKIINNRVVSTKKEGGIHGIGLSSITKTAEQYNGSFSYYTEDKKFVAVLILTNE